MPSFTSSFRAWFLTWLVLTLAIFAGGLAATEVLIRTRVEPNDLFEQHLETYFNARTGNAAFGDSIVAYGFLPDSPDFVNLATDGEVPHGTLTKIRAFYDNRPAGKVILPANHNMLRRGLLPQDDYQEIFSQRRRSLLRIAETRHRGYAFRYWHSLLFGAFQNRRKILPFGGEAYVDPAENDSYGAMAPEARAVWAEGKMQREVPQANERSDANRANFVDILDFLRGRADTVCAVSFPMSPSFRRAAAAVPAFAEARRWYREQAERAGATYVDLWDLLDDDRYFWDPTHLGVTGARKVTPLILERCFGEESGAGAS